MATIPMWSLLTLAGDVDALHANAKLPKMQLFTLKKPLAVGSKWAKNTLPMAASSTRFTPAHECL
jgi:hypothetical protein